MNRHHDTKTKRNPAALLAAAYLLGIGTGFVAAGGAAAGRGFVVAGAVALAASLVVVLLRRGGAKKERAGLAWPAPTAVGEELPTVNDYYSNSPDGAPTSASSPSPYRRWEPLPPEGAVVAEAPAGAPQAAG